MKNFIMLLVAMFLISFPVFAQGTEIDTGFSFDATTFAGVVAFVTMTITQLAKFIPFVDSNRWVKILLSIVIGALSALIFWKLGWATFLIGYALWQVLAIGALAGLSAGKAFDIIKDLFRKKE
jgi:hypothetical protein